jgi:prevent-host-death family protein
MISAGVKELKNNLSRYLAKVKTGEEVLITERGKIVARIVQEDSSNASIRKALRPLVEKGLVALPSQEIDREKIEPLEVSGQPVSDMVLEDRR